MKQLVILPDKSGEVKIDLCHKPYSIEILDAIPISPDQFNRVIFDWYKEDLGNKSGTAFDYFMEHIQELK